MKLEVSILSGNVHRKRLCEVAVGGGGYRAGVVEFQEWEPNDDLAIEGFS